MIKQYILTIVFTGLVLFAFGQTDSNNVTSEDLNKKYREIYDQAETYNEYKVFKITSINGLWKSVQDSIKSFNQEIGRQGGEINSLNENISGLDKRISELEFELAESNKKVDSISFLGIFIKKSVYNIILWSIIAGLIAILAVGYLSHARNRNLYLRANKDFTELVDEFEDYRRQSQDNKVKMGRELQTERNKVAELQSRMGLRDL